MVQKGYIHSERRPRVGHTGVGGFLDERADILRVVLQLALVISIGGTGIPAPRRRPTCDPQMVVVHAIHSFMGCGGVNLSHAPCSCRNRSRQYCTAGTRCVLQDWSVLMKPAANTCD